MSISLYRKYRPNTFSSIIGQEEIVSTLTNQLLQNKLSHAYMFIGTRGTGKTSTAKVLAKAVNCTNLKNGDPCNECDSCKDMDNTLDIIELDAASNNGVDDIRRLIEDCSYPPSAHKYKVYIIDEVHMLSKGAFNALLKTLEEPPSYVIFILCTTEAHRVPATIRSRCVKFEFKRITLEKMIKRMKLICNSEGRIAEDTALRLIAVNSDGAMRDALSMLEQSFYLSSKITEDVVADMLGCSNIDTLIDFIEAIFSMNIKNIISYLNYLLEKGKDVMILIQEVIKIVRDCMLLKATNGDFIVEGTTEYKNKLIGLIEVIPLETIMYIINTLNDIYNKAKYSMNPCLVLQMGFTMMCMPTFNSYEELVSKIQELDKKVNSIIESGKIVTKEIAIEKYINPVYHDEDNLFVSSSATAEKLNSIKSDSTNELSQNKQPVAPTTNELKDYVDSLKKSDIIFLTLTQNAEIKCNVKFIEIKTKPIFHLPLIEIYGNIFKNRGYILEVHE